MKKVSQKYVFEDSSSELPFANFLLSSVSSPHLWHVDVDPGEDGTLVTLEECSTGIKLSLRFESRLEALAFRDEFEIKLNTPKQTKLKKYIEKVKENPKTAISILTGIALLGTFAYRSRDIFKKGIEALYEKTTSEKFNGLY